MRSKSPNKRSLSRRAAATNDKLQDPAVIETVSRQISTNLVALKDSIESIMSTVDSKMTTILDSKISAIDQTIDSKLNLVNEAVDFRANKLNNQTIYAKFSTLNQRISNVENSVKSLEERFNEHARFQRLTHWIDHKCKLCSFSYYEHNNPYSVYPGRRNNSDLVTHILACFFSGSGYCLPCATLESISFEHRVKFEASEKEFHTKVIEKIYILTGNKPRVAHNPIAFLIFSTAEKTINRIKKCKFLAPTTRNTIGQMHKIITNKC